MYAIGLPMRYSWEKGSICDGGGSSGVSSWDQVSQYLTATILNLGRVEIIWGEGEFFLRSKGIYSMTKKSSFCLRYSFYIS